MTAINWSLAANIYFVFQKELRMPGVFLKEIFLDVVSQVPMYFAAKCITANTLSSPCQQGHLLFIAGLRPLGCCDNMVRIQILSKVRQVPFV